MLFGVRQRRKRDYVIGYKIVRCKLGQYTEDALKRGLDFPEPPFPYIGVTGTWDSGS